MTYFLQTPILLKYLDEAVPMLFPRTLFNFWNRAWLRDIAAVLVACPHTCMFSPARLLQHQQKGKKTRRITSAAVALWSTRMTSRRFSREPPRLLPCEICPKCRPKAVFEKYAERINTSKENAGCSLGAFVLHLPHVDISFFHKQKGPYDGILVFRTPRCPLFYGSFVTKQKKKETLQSQLQSTRVAKLDP